MAQDSPLARLSPQSCEWPGQTGDDEAVIANNSGNACFTPEGATRIIVAAELGPLQPLCLGVAYTSNRYTRAAVPRYIAAFSDSE